ncbi:zinc dependent phospholipase C family protein [Fulvivirga maritima]|uniref:zinc dependent phospholipase C family protein n=1 Tax=Fulvivirga maritima TaxID=2904247 RepID=UPI001F380198|nr:zinc dependent phospholipase C family protein [Fulvivirga maritima]UII27108.1 zinc dependent phospholipase C family protein [Fulvivirga maritima]
MRIFIKKMVFSLLFLILSAFNKYWGFYGHQKISRLAVFTLPVEMIGFYKHNIRYLTENAVNPDKRRYAVEGEASRHFIDVDVYGDSAVYTMPRYWQDAVEKYTEDTLKAYGIVPWHVYRMKGWLTDAMRIRDGKSILRLSAEIGHYIADANVPLHTTENYNGQLTGQRGIHGLWESRLSELFSEDYDFFVGRAEYLDNAQLAIWEGVVHAHEALDSVLSMEIMASEKLKEDKKYSFETRGSATIKVYSREFSEEYHQMLDGMVERQMRRAVKMVGDFWYTCWVDAGQPDLESVIDVEFTEEELNAMKEELKQWKEKRYSSRQHDN